MVSVIVMMAVPVVTLGFFLPLFLHFLAVFLLGFLAPLDHFLDVVAAVFVGMVIIVIAVR